MKETLHFDACIGLWTYDGLVRQAVVAAKYGSQVALADALGRRLSQVIHDVFVESEGVTDADELARSGDRHDSGIDLPDWITPVPSHLWRRIQRGGGGSRVLAATVARTLRKTWPTTKLVNLMETTRPIKKQAWLGEKDRAKNVSGAFQLTRPLSARWFGRADSANALKGLHVLVIDDVMTTGATANEIAGLLKRYGARRVTIGVVARAHSG